MLPSIAPTTLVATNAQSDLPGSVGESEKEQTFADSQPPIFFIRPIDECNTDLYPLELKAGEDSGIDIRFPKDVKIPAGETATISMGIEVACEVGGLRAPFWFVPRSSIGKTALLPEDGLFVHRALKREPEPAALSVTITNTGKNEWEIKRGAALFQIADSLLRPAKCFRSAKAFAEKKAVAGVLSGRDPEDKTRKKGTGITRLLLLPDDSARACIIGGFCPTGKDPPMTPLLLNNPASSTNVADDAKNSEINPTKGVCKGGSAQPNPLICISNSRAIPAVKNLEFAPGATTFVRLGVRACWKDGDGKPVAFWLKLDYGMALFSPPPLVMQNCRGLIDRGYRGELCANIYNRGTEVVRVAKGAPMFTLEGADEFNEFFIDSPTVEMVANDHADFKDGATARGAGGFGSTGVSGGTGAANSGKK